MEHCTTRINSILKDGFVSVRVTRYSDGNEIRFPVYVYDYISFDNIVWG